MKTDLIYALTGAFEAHAQLTEGGIEFWLARDLQHLLGYTEWRNFTAVISKAKTACEVSQHPISDHFVDVNKMVDLGSGSQREVDDSQEQAMAALECGDLSPLFKTLGTRWTRGRSYWSWPAAGARPLRRRRVKKSGDKSPHSKVRKTLLERGIRPETLPASEDVKKVERRLASDTKKSLKHPESLDT